MSTITPRAINSNTVQGGYGSVWSSVYDFVKPQVRNNVVKQVGKGIGLADFAHIMGSTVTVAGATTRVYEEGSQFKLVELGAQIAVAAEGADIAVTLAATEYDANGKCYLSDWTDALVIPAYYLQEDGAKSVRPEVYQIISHAGVGAATVWTARPQKDNVAIVAAVPNGTKLQVVGALQANESLGSKPKATGWYYREFHNSTVRTAGQIFGSTESIERWTDALQGGTKGVFTKSTVEADIEHTKKISDNLFISGGVTNAALVRANRDGDNIAVTGTVGVFQHLVDRAMPQYYTAAYDKPCFEDIGPALESQGVLGRNVAMFYGSELGRQIENLNLDFIKEFSGGTDFMKTMGEIDSTFKAVKYNGVFTTLHGLSVLNDPIAYGAESHDDQFRSLGFLVPDVDVTVKKTPDSTESLTLKNFTLGYKAYGKENRTRIFKWLPGVNGLGVGGEMAVDTYDDVRFEMLTEFQAICNGFNQLILIQDDRILVNP